VYRAYARTPEPNEGVLFVHWASAANNAANTKVPRSQESWAVTLDFSFGVSGRWSFNVGDVR
jgi:hypothetical protein